jgi:hypothetical protein
MEGIENNKISDIFKLKEIARQNNILWLISLKNSNLKAYYVSDTYRFLLLQKEHI